MAEMRNDMVIENGIDALIPQDIAIKAELVGARKVRQDALTLLVFATLAGAFIGLGSMFATTVLAGTAGNMPFGLARLIAGAVFSLGLILVVLGGAELFTGNTLMVMALAGRKISMREMLRAWAIVYVGMSSVPLAPRSWCSSRDNVWPVTGPSRKSP